MEDRAKKTGLFIVNTLAAGAIVVTVGALLAFGWDIGKRK